MASARAKTAPVPQSPTPNPQGAAPRGLTGSGGSGIARNGAWVCGHRTLPLYVQRVEGGPFRPEFVAWVSPSGVLAASPAPPDEVEEAVLGLLRHVLAHPLNGQPRRPSSVRVNDAALAPAIVKALGPGVEVRVGPTPEIDALVDHFVNHLDRENPAPDTDPWVDDGLDPERVRGFFAAAAALYRAAPWKVVPDDATLFAVDAPALALKGACLSIVGGAGIDFGFLLFDSVADYRAMRQKVTAIEEGESPKVPWVPLFSVSFEPSTEMPKATRAAIAERGWPVAGPKAYPLLLLVDPDDAMRPPTGDDLVRAWALSEALTRLLHDHPRRLAEGPGPPLSATYLLEGVPGRPKVTLTLPHPDNKQTPAVTKGPATKEPGARALAAKKGAPAKAAKKAGATAKAAGTAKPRKKGAGAAAKKGAGAAAKKSPAAAKKSPAAAKKSPAAAKKSPAAAARKGAGAAAKKGAGAAAKKGAGVRGSGR